MSGLAEDLKVVEHAGHLSPVPIHIIYPNGNSRDAMLVGIGSQVRDAYVTHQLVVLADGGASKRSLWLDTIATIQGTSKLRTLRDEFVITLKNGTSINVTFSAWSDFGGGECGGAAKQGEVTCDQLFVNNPDGGIEKIDFCSN